MNPTFRQSMTWLHTWAGITLCWIMYFMFVTGTLGYFDTEIDRWMRPEVAVNQDVTLEKSLSLAQSRLQDVASNASRWRIAPVKERDNLNLFINYRVPKQGGGTMSQREYIDTDTGEPVNRYIRATGGGQTLYRMHYRFHYIDRTIADYLATFVALAMFLGVLTGIIIHRKIFKNLFTLRTRKKGSAWLDMHNLVAVTTLPFQLLISYSGLLFMATIIFPLIALGGYGFNIDSVEDLSSTVFPSINIEKSGKQAELADLTTILSSFDPPLTPEQVRSLEVIHPNDTNARIGLRTTAEISTRGGYLYVFDGVTGALLDTQNLNSSSGIFFYNTMLSLHEGLFAGPLLRWLYFLAGTFGAAMMATGSIYWVKKRQQKSSRPVTGFQLVINLNIGWIIGLLTGIAAYFWANRILPLSITDRADWEVHCLFIVWLICLVHPFTRRNKTQAWFEQCLFAGLLFSAIPLLNALTTDTHIVNSALNGNWVLMSFDLTCSAVGFLFILVAVKLRNRVNYHRINLSDFAPSPPASEIAS